MTHQCIRLWSCGFFVCVLLAGRSVWGAESAGGLVVGIHDLELKPGVDVKAFEKFVKEEFAPVWKEPRDGLRILILKGTRGARKDKYQWVFMFDSVATRDRLFPQEGSQGGEAYESIMKPHAAVLTKLDSFLDSNAPDNYSDFQSIGD